MVSRTTTRRTSLILAGAAALSVVGGAATPAFAAGKQYTIVVIPKLVGIPWFQAVKQSVDKASKELPDTRVIWQGPAVDLLEEHCAFDNMRGVRQLLNWDDDPDKRFCDRSDYLTDTKWQSGYALLRKYNLSFDLQIYHPQMEDSYRLAERFSDIQIILNHTGMPIDRSPEGLRDWRRAMKRLAGAPNAACKISGLAMTNWRWTADSIRADVLGAIEAFGVDRCLFASNFPVDKLFSSYDTIFDAFKAIARNFSESERLKLFHDNAVRIYRL
jgi:predicted TIM-barrel fold metal-dependent hydrolase